MHVKFNNNIYDNIVRNKNRITLPTAGGKSGCMFISCLFMLTKLSGMFWHANTCSCLFMHYYFMLGHVYACLSMFMHAFFMFIHVHAIIRHVLACQCLFMLVYVIFFHVNACLCVFMCAHACLLNIYFYIIVRKKFA